MNFNYIKACPIVKGNQRDCIYDLYRQKIHLIPKTLTYIIEEYAGKVSWDYLNTLYPDNTETLEEYHQFLTDNELIFFSDDSEYFTNFPLEWDSPSLITNAIICVREESDFEVSSLFKQFDELNCNSFEVRILNAISMASLKNYLEAIEASRARSTSIVLNQAFYPIETIKQLVESHCKIIRFSIYNHSEEKTLFHKVHRKNIPISYYSHSIQHSINTHKVAIENVNIPMFTEGQNHHTYFNRKLTIDANGDIKQCPTIEKSYGNIKKTTLQQAIDKEGFKNLWNASKGNTLVCKDCEFRFMCIDTRQPHQKEDGTWYHSSSCNYNPYTTEWKT